MAVALRNDSLPGGSGAAKLEWRRLVVRLCSSADRSTFLTLGSSEFPDSEYACGVFSNRFLVTPLLREGTCHRSDHHPRTEVEPFSEKQIELVTTFADQAVIAIENMRLLKELQTRNRDLTEALEQQTATSEVLNIIAARPSNCSRCIRRLFPNTTRLCEANIAAHFLYEGEVSSGAAPMGLRSVRQAPRRNQTKPRAMKHPLARLSLERRTVHVADLDVRSDLFSQAARLYESEHLPRMSVPMLREERLDRSDH